MKFLESQELDYLNAHYLGQADVGDKILNAKVEVYSCKPFKTEHDWKRTMEQHFSTSPPTTNPLSPDKNTHFLLISTLNWSFPDYDWSTSSPELFIKQTNLRDIRSQLDELLVDPIEQSSPTAEPSFKERFWTAIESQSLGLEDCEVFKYAPSSDSEIFVRGKLYGFNYFFYNKKLKRLVFVAGAAVSKLHSHAEETMESIMDLDEGMSFEEN